MNPLYVDKPMKCEFCDRTDTAFLLVENPGFGFYACPDHYNKTMRDVFIEQLRDE